MQAVLYHSEACEAVAEGALVELCDWCARALAHLASDECRAAAAWTGALPSPLLLLPPPLQCSDHLLLSST